MEIPGKLPQEMLALVEEEFKSETNPDPEILVALEEYNNQLT